MFLQNLQLQVKTYKIKKFGYEVNTKLVWLGESENVYHTTANGRETCQKWSPTTQAVQKLRQRFCSSGDVVRQRAAAHNATFN